MQVTPIPQKSEVKLDTGDTIGIPDIIWKQSGLVEENVKIECRGRKLEVAFVVRHFWSTSSHVVEGFLTGVQACWFGRRPGSNITPQVLAAFPISIYALRTAVVPH